MECTLVPELLVEYSMAMINGSHLEVPELALLYGRQHREEEIHVQGTTAADEDMAEDERAGLCVDLAIGTQNGEAVVGNPVSGRPTRIRPLVHQGLEYGRVDEVSDLPRQAEERKWFDRHAKCLVRSDW